jgi:hypothetical protein
MYLLFFFCYGMKTKFEQFVLTSVFCTVKPSCLSGFELGEATLQHPVLMAPFAPLGNFFLLLECDVRFAY